MSISEYVTEIMSSGLNITPKTIYESTLTELNLIVDGMIKKQKEEEQMANIRAGTITAAIYNILKDKHRQAFTWDDFFVDLYSSSKPASSEATTPQEIYNAFKAMFGKPAEVNVNGA